MAFTRRFNQVRTPLACACADSALLSPMGWEPLQASVSGTWPQVQTPLPKPPPSSVLFHTAGGIEHLFSVFKSFRWLPIPLKLGFGHLNVPYKVLRGGSGFYPPLQPHLLSVPPLCGLRPSWPPTSFLLHHILVSSGPHSCCPPCSAPNQISVGMSLSLGASHESQPV